MYNTDTDESSGKWGDWNSDQDCSRTCGGGVLVESRECQDGDCTGPSKRYSSCNTQECPPNTKDFRLEQCQKFNSVPFERKLYDWIPYLKAPRKCELNCMPRGERFYYRHEKMVNLKIIAFINSSFRNPLFVQKFKKLILGGRWHSLRSARWISTRLRRRRMYHRRL